MKKMLIFVCLMGALSVMAQTSCVPEPYLGAAAAPVKRHQVIKRAYRSVAVYPAQVVRLSGDVLLVEHNGVAVQQKLMVGSKLQLNDVVQTGRQSFVTIVLGAGVSSSLPSNTKIRLQQSSNSVARYELLDGGIENRVIKKPNASRSTFEITVPNGILGVRGTHFWVLADVGINASAVSVADGVVVARPLKSCSAPLVISQNQSALVKPVFSPSDVVASLPAPELVLNNAQRGTDLLFDIKPVVGANMYVVQVARDEQFTDLIAEARGSERVVVPAADMADAFYYVRTGSIDARGINGFGQSSLFLRNRE